MLLIHFFLCLILFHLPAVSADEMLEGIEVTEKESSQIADFDVPLSETPLSISSYSSSDFLVAKVKRLADISSLDAAVTDSYNSSGYFDIIAIRGFTLDNRFSFQREGLPINAETSIPLENKERIEVLKGISNLHSGVGAPGGMVNYVVKRPLAKPQTVLRTELAQRHNQIVSMDSSLRPMHKMSLRINAAQENISPVILNSKGDRSLLSGAVSFQISEDSLVEGEVEWSRKSQPSVPGFSLLGDKLPSVPDPNLNLNKQNWTKPVVFQGTTGSLTYTYLLSSEWSSSLKLGAQRLTTDDRLAFPYGCSKEGRFDRYCSDGTYDVYDYRSENERRETDSGKLEIKGRVKFPSLSHHLGFGGWVTRSEDKMNRQAYNFVGEGNVSGDEQLPSDSSLTEEGTNRTSSSLDFFAYDRIEWERWSLWLGARQTNISRKSSQTDGSRFTKYKQDFILPWSAISYEFQHFLSYVSYSEGVESFVTPNKSEYDSRGEYLPGVVSRQWELGFKGRHDIPWSLILFQIDRPLVTDAPPKYEVDGIAEHRGVEASFSKTYFPWNFEMSYMKLDSKRKDAKINSDFNNKSMVNVPDQNLKLNVGREVPHVKGLNVNLRWMYEGKRAALPDNSIMLPAWNKWDMNLAYSSKRWLALLSLENAFAKRYWKESPTQYGHVYLFPGMARRVSLSVQYGFD